MNKHTAKQNPPKYIIYLLVIALLLFGLYKIMNVSNIDPLIITTSDHVKGNLASKVILVEYSDFQCPACGAYYPLVEKLTAGYKDKIEFVYRNYPLTQVHQNAHIAAQAAEAAAVQGKFWEMYNNLFSEQDLWSSMKKPETRFETYAKDLGLDVNKFLTDMQGSQVDDKIENDIKRGNIMGVDSTPTFVLNGVKIEHNPKSYDDFAKLIDDALANTVLTQNTEQNDELMHLHADFKVYIYNVAYDFSQAKYQTTEEDEDKYKGTEREYIHLHDGNGEMIHIHKDAISLGDFFKSLAMDLTSDSLTLDSGEKYQNNEAASLKVYINGKKIEDFANYKIADLDKILISYGVEDDSVIQTQIASVKDEACMYSEKCPERGPAPKESCVGGLGSKCK